MKYRNGNNEEILNPLVIFKKHPFNILTTMHQG